MQVTWSSCAADLRRWNFRVSVAFVISESWNSRIPSSEYDLRRQAYHVTNLEVHFFIWFCCHSYENAPNVIQTTAMVRGVPCTIHGHGTPVDKGRCPFYSIFMGTGIPSISRPNPLPVASQHITMVKPRAGLNQRCPWEGARLGGDWWIAACCSVLCLKSIQMNGETSFIQHIFAYLSYLALNMKRFRTCSHLKKGLISDMNFDNHYRSAGFSTVMKRGDVIHTVGCGQC